MVGFFLYHSIKRNSPEVHGPRHQWDRAADRELRMMLLVLWVKLTKSKKVNIPELQSQLTKKR